MDKARLRSLIQNPLPQEFYCRNTVQVAKDLLGKVLTIVIQDQMVSGRIVETEAYMGDDPASHSARGETPRSKIMFGTPGVAYVYFIYGMYEMLNFVTEPVGQAGAVLIRAVEPIFGVGNQLTNGPGKLCRAFGIQMSHNGQSLRGPELYVSDDGHRPSSISSSGRVGIRLATEKPWRFFVTGHSCVSRAPQNSKSQIVHL